MSLFSSLKPTANPSRNVFDLSRSETFSLKLGMLTPCFVEHTIPNGKYKIDISNICRVDSQVTANFVGMSQVVDFYFVPYSQLWHDFNKFYDLKGEETRMLSGTINTTQPAYVPTFNLKAVVQALFGAIIDFELYDTYVRDCIASGTTISSYILSWASNQEIISSGDSEHMLMSFCDIHGRFCGYDQLRVLDMLGYGNYLPLIKFVCPGFDSATAATYAQSIIDGSGSSESYAAYRANLISVASAPIPETYPNSFAIMAYVKIFNDIYMNRIYPQYHLEQFYNIDYFKGTSTGAYDTLTAIAALRPWYRMYKKDLFTALYPNPQFGDVSVAVLENPSTISSAQSLANANYRLGINTTSAKSVVLRQNDNSIVSNSDKWIINSSVSALSIRQSLAFQRYKETLLRAGNREDDLQRAMFGVGSHYIEDKYVDFLGSFQSSLQLNPVASTTENESVSVGELGAYSVGSIGMGDGKTIEYDAKDFGMIIGISYIMPETKYEAMGIDAQNTKFEPDDYFNPKMQNLGLHPVYKHRAITIGIGQNGSNSFSDSVLGYSAEYNEYKTKISKVHGEFFGSNPMIPISLGQMSSYDSETYERALTSSYGSFSMFVSPRDVRDVAEATRQVLYIAPWDCDRVFQLSDTPRQASDHFKMEMSFRVKAVLPMSVVGLPQ